MSKRARGKAVAQRRWVARDLTAKRSTVVGGGLAATPSSTRMITYNGHAGLGANRVVLVGTGAGARGGQ